MPRPTSVTVLLLLFVGLICVFLLPWNRDSPSISCAQLLPLPSSSPHTCISGASEPSLYWRGYDIPLRLVALTGDQSNWQPVADAHEAVLEKFLAPFNGQQDVLEVGCGVGRDAISLSTKLFPSKSYVGVDIIGDSISWAKRYISAVHPKMQFYHFDVRDALHNPFGRLNISDVRFPCLDRSVDRIYGFSVFTHMLEPAVQHYLLEFERILRPGGKALLTIFWVNDETLASARRNLNLTPWKLGFEHEIAPGCFINNRDVPEGAVAFRQAALDRMLAKVPRLKEVAVIKGSWSGLPIIIENPAGQDVWLLERRA